MHHNKFLRYVTFALLYFVQGIVWSYFISLNSLYLLSHGLTLTRIGIFGSLVYIPFIAKVLLGLLSDRVNLFGLGHRRPWILIGLVLQSLCLLIIPAINPSSGFWLLTGTSLLMLLGMALYDTSTDGLAVETSAVEEEGIIQAFMVSGRALGVVVAGSTLGFLAESVSWRAVFLVLAAATLLPLPLAAGMKEPKRAPGQRFEWVAFSSLKSPRIILLVLAGLAVSSAMAGANQLLNPFLQESFKISLGQAGLYTTIWGLGFFAGGAVGGLLHRYVGERRSSWIAVPSIMLGILLLALIPNTVLAWGIAGLFGIAYGIFSVVFYSISMHVCDTRIAASMFSIQMAFVNLATSIGIGLGGILSDSVGFRTTFLFFAALPLLALPLFGRFFKLDTKPRHDAIEQVHFKG